MNEFEKWLHRKIKNPDYIEGVDSLKLKYTTYYKHRWESEYEGHIEELEKCFDFQQNKITELEQKLEKAIEVITSIAHNGYEDENGRHEIYPEQSAQEFLQTIKEKK